MARKKVQDKRQKIIVIVGPTASGKSDLGIRIAKKFGGEIISADSRQVYRGMKIGTAQVTGKRKNRIFVSEGIPHYGIDFVSPKKIYTAAEFKQYARDTIKKISSAHKLSLIVGGTGFWVDSLVYDLDLPSVKPDWRLRRKLEKKSTTRLLAMLMTLDPNRAASIEKQNPRRLIRAIEIASVIGRVPALTKKRPYRACWIGISAPQNVLQRRIEIRARAMIHRGLIVETRKLLLQGVTKKRMRELGFEYIAALRFIEKKINRGELLTILVHDTLRYAKRQKQWFKKNHAIHWISKPQEADKLVTKFLADN